MRAGLYIHVPFCGRKCRYCDFYSIAYDSASVNYWLSALEREWALLSRRDDVAALRFDTVYLGGGTPSMLSAEQWRRLMAAAHACPGAVHASECTVECNPESFDDEKATRWVDTGVTRLSVGVQSLDDGLLALLGRPHDMARVLRVFASKTLACFAAVGVDVLYGIPGQTVAQVRATLRRLLDTGVVTHVSAYELTLSRCSPMGRDRTVVASPEQLRVEMHHVIREQLHSAGFEQYEISNYALPGFRSRHNSAYWRHEPYIGLGPAAHSFVMPRRWSNVADTGQYAAGLRRDEQPLAHEETLGRAELVRETLMLGLRTSEGLRPAHFRAVTGEDLCDGRREDVLRSLIREGLLLLEDGSYVPTSVGMLLADAIALRLM